MLKFVIYDDEDKYLNGIEKIIKKATKDNQYDIVKFKEYNKEFQDVIKDDSKKIYILDIEIPNGLSGVDVARNIRKNDWDSMIILVTAHLEKVFSVVQAQIMILGLISKTNKFQDNLISAIETSIKKINQTKVLTFTTQNITYKIFTDDIYYITKDSVERKCIIKNKYNEAPIYENLSSVLNKLDDRFVIISRSCIVNVEKISKVDWKNCIIYFDNGTSNNYLSRSKKKELRNKIENYS